MKMFVSKIVHKNEVRIKVEFDYDAESLACLRKIKDTRWSKTLHAWHIPYNKESFDQLKSFFPDLEYESMSKEEKIAKTENEIRIKLIKPVEKAQAPLQLILKKNVQDDLKTIIRPVEYIEKNAGVHIAITPKRLFIRLPKNDTDIQYLRSFRYVNWDNANRQWIVPNYGKNLELLKSYFDKRQVSYTNSNDLRIIEKIEVEIEAGKLKVVNIRNRVLKVYVSFNHDLIVGIKKLTKCKWNPAENCWTAPYSISNAEHLRELAQNHSLQYSYEIKSGTAGAPRLPKAANFQKCPAEYIDKLKEIRYSKNTLDTYTDLFEEFINYYANKSLPDITEDEIVAFLRYLVNIRKVSTSYQNQSINAIKFYYERVLGGKRKIYFIERPIKENYLPEVLSEEEISQLIKTIQNIKHRAIIMTIYSGGLRISELINLKIKDINSDRMQLRISQSKGKKDRYTLLSKKTLLILRQYFKEYKPNQWLFEGEGQRQYSCRAIQNILRIAVIKAGIKKHVTVHTLRHSFATHLLEHGTELRYIQSLLGHSNSKTTEIYTHITTKGFNQIKSPLDEIEF